MTFRSLLAVLALSISTGDQAAAATTDAPLAVASPLPPAVTSEINAVMYMATAAKRAEAWANKGTIRQIVEERFTIKQWDATNGALSFSAEEKAYVDYQQAVNRLKAGLDIAERRRLAQIEGDPTILRTRAREIYLDNPRAYDNPEQANVSLIVIDMTKRDWRATQAHIATIKKALTAKNVDFSAVARRLTDDVLSQQGKRDVTLWVTEQQAERPVRNKLFVTMKPGEISEPLTSTAGLVILKLNERKPKTARPFEEVEQQIVAQLLDEQGKTARRTVMASLTLPPITYSSELAPEQSGGPDYSTAVLQIIEQGVRDGKSQEEISRLVKQAIEAAGEKR